MINIKNEDQINRIRESCHVLAETFDYVEKHVVEGITTAEIDKLTHDYIVKRGGTPAFLGYGGFPGAICSSVNDTVIHGISQFYKTKKW